MTAIKQTDRDAAEEWKWYLYDRDDFDPIKGMEEAVAELAQDFARHREQAATEERAKIVAYLVKGRAGIIAANIKAGEHLK